jgi:hypothetical protein
MLEQLNAILAHPDLLQTQVDQETAVMLIVSVAVAFVAITLQFLTVLRHKGQDAVINSFTWLLLAAFAAAAGGLIWQRHGEFFLTLLMEILASGALAGTILNLRYRKLLKEVAKQRQRPEHVPREFENVAEALRLKLRSARLVKQLRAEG